MRRLYDFSKGRLSDAFEKKMYGLFFNTHDCVHRAKKCLRW